MAENIPIPAPGGEVHPKNFIQTKVKIGPQGIEENTAYSKDIRGKYQQPETASEVAHIPLDKTRLNRIVMESSMPGARFGKEVNLDQEDIDQISKVIESSNALLETAKQQSQAEWDELSDIFKKLHNEGTDQLISQRIINGGPSAKVALNYENNVPRITVPERLFRIYQLGLSIKSTQRFIAESKDVRQGTSTEFLARGLTHVAGFLKDNNKI